MISRDAARPSQTRSRPTIDYLGAALLAAALSAIVLVASLGGTTWAVGLGADGARRGRRGRCCSACSSLVERRAREPVLPLSLLRDEVFRVAALLSLIVGFALFGSVTFLPLFFQTVFHASPTGGRAAADPADGRARARLGHLGAADRDDRALPALPDRRHGADDGRACSCSRGSGSARARWRSTARCSCSGLGLGLTMQVLVLAVQNAVAYEVLGAATSGVTLARGIGGSFGAAIFGTIFTTGCARELAGRAARRRSARRSPAAGA